MTTSSAAERSADGPAESAPAEDSGLFAYRTLRDEILRGDLAPGARLSQVQLAKRLGISRTPLREALRRLEVEHLIDGGDFNQRMHVSELSLNDFDQIYAMRVALEPVGVAMTVPELSGEEQTELRGWFDAMTAAIDARDLQGFQEAHRAFHLGLTAKAGDRVQGVIAELWDHSERYRLAYLRHDYADPGSASLARLRLSQSEHEQILSAALAHDVRRCADELVAHLHRTVETVLDEQLRSAPSATRVALRNHLTR